MFLRLHGSVWHQLTGHIQAWWQTKLAKLTWLIETQLIASASGNILNTSGTIQIPNQDPQAFQCLSTAYTAQTVVGCMFTHHVLLYISMQFEDILHPKSVCGILISRVWASTCSQMTIGLRLLVIIQSLNETFTLINQQHSWFRWAEVTCICCNVFH